MSKEGSFYSYVPAELTDDCLSEMDEIRDMIRNCPHKTNTILNINYELSDAYFKMSET